MFDQLVSQLSDAALVKAAAHAPNSFGRAFADPYGMTVLTEFDGDLAAAQTQLALAEASILTICGELQSKIVRREREKPPGPEMAEIAVNIGAADTREVLRQITLRNFEAATTNDPDFRADLHQLITFAAAPATNLVKKATLATMLQTIMIARDRRALNVSMRADELLAAAALLEWKVCCEEILMDAAARIAFLNSVSSSTPSTSDIDIKLLSSTFSPIELVRLQSAVDFLSGATNNKIAAALVSPSSAAGPSFSLLSLFYDLVEVTIPATALLSLVTSPADGIAEASIANAAVRRHFDCVGTVVFLSSGASGTSSSSSSSSARINESEEAEANTSSSPSAAGTTRAMTAAIAAATKRLRGNGNGNDSDIVDACNFSPSLDPPLTLERERLFATMTHGIPYTQTGTRPGQLVQVAGDQVAMAVSLHAEGTGNGNDFCDSEDDDGDAADKKTTKSTKKRGTNRRNNSGDLPSSSTMAATSTTLTVNAGANGASTAGVDDHLPEGVMMALPEDFLYKGKKEKETTPSSTTTKKYEEDRNQQNEDQAIDSKQASSSSNISVAVAAVAGNSTSSSSSEQAPATPLSLSAALSPIVNRLMALSSSPSSSSALLSSSFSSSSSSSTLAFPGARITKVTTATSSSSSPLVYVPSSSDDDLPNPMAASSSQLFDGPVAAPAAAVVDDNGDVFASRLLPHDVVIGGRVRSTANNSTAAGSSWRKALRAYLPCDADSVKDTDSKSSSCFSIAGPDDLFSAFANATAAATSTNASDCLQLLVARPRPIVALLAALTGRSAPSTGAISSIDLLKEEAPVVVAPPSASAAPSSATLTTTSATLLPLPTATPQPGVDGECLTLYESCLLMGLEASSFNESSCTDGSTGLYTGYSPCGTVQVDRQLREYAKASGITGPPGGGGSGQPGGNNAGAGGAAVGGAGSGAAGGVSSEGAGGTASSSASGNPNGPNANANDGTGCLSASVGEGWGATHAAGAGIVPVPGHGPGPVVGTLPQAHAAASVAAALSSTAKQNPHNDFGTAAPAASAVAVSGSPVAPAAGALGGLAPPLGLPLNLTGVGGIGVGGHHQGPLTGAHPKKYHKQSSLPVVFSANAVIAAVSTLHHGGPVAAGVHAAGAHANHFQQHPLLQQQQSLQQLHPHAHHAPSAVVGSAAAAGEAFPIGNNSNGNSTTTNAAAASGATLSGVKRKRPEDGGEGNADAGAQGEGGADGNGAHHQGKPFKMPKIDTSSSDTAKTEEEQQGGNAAPVAPATNDGAATTITAITAAGSGTSTNPTSIPTWTSGMPALAMDWSPALQAYASIRATNAASANAMLQDDNGSGDKNNEIAPSHAAAAVASSSSSSSASSTDDPTAHLTTVSRKDILLALLRLEHRASRVHAHHLAMQQAQQQAQAAQQRAGAGGAAVSGGAGGSGGGGLPKSSRGSFSSSAAAAAPGSPLGANAAVSAGTSPNNALHLNLPAPDSPPLRGSSAESHVSTSFVPIALAGANAANTNTAAAVVGPAAMSGTSPLKAPGSTSPGTAGLGGAQPSALEALASGRRGHAVRKHLSDIGLAAPPSPPPGAAAVVMAASSALSLVVPPPPAAAPPSPPPEGAAGAANGTNSNNTGNNTATNNNNSGANSNRRRPRLSSACSRGSTGGGMGGGMGGSGGGSNDDALVVAGAPASPSANGGASAVGASAGTGSGRRSRGDSSASANSGAGAGNNSSTKKKGPVGSDLATPVSMNLSNGASWPGGALSLAALASGLQASSGQCKITVRQFTSQVLRTICDVVGLPSEGDKVMMMRRIHAFLQSDTTDEPYPEAARVIKGYLKKQRLLNATKSKKHSEEGGDGSAMQVDAADGTEETKEEEEPQQQEQELFRLPRVSDEELAHLRSLPAFQNANPIVFSPFELAEVEEAMLHCYYPGAPTKITVVTKAGIEAQEALKAAGFTPAPLSPSIYDAYLHTAPPSPQAAGAAGAGGSTGR
jgi:hypothetical protein